MSDNTDLVSAFCDCWQKGDLDTILSFLAVDCTWHNLPMEPLVGHEAIGGMISGFQQLASNIRFEMISIAEAADGRVLTERMDHLIVNGHKLALPVMGSFEILNGKISRWFDYYDQATMDKLLASAGAGG